MSRRKLLLSSLGLALLLTVCVAANLSDPDDDATTWARSSSPITGYGSLVERTLRFAPPLHDAIWPPLLPVLW